MTNIINSLTNTNNNIIGAYKLSDKHTGQKKLLSQLKAPPYYPAYSPEYVIREQENLRKNIYFESYKREKIEKRNHTIASLLKTILFVTGIYLLISKIKFKSK